MCELLRENAAMLYAEMEENGMTLTADIPEETIPVWADELQLSRVVTNLLTNAMQHNPKGTRIGLFAYRELERIYVLVADSGILIPEEQAQHLFDPFTRGDKARVSDGRNGLGLSIVSKIVQMHGWDLNRATATDSALCKSSRICKSICDPDGKCRYVFCAFAKIKKWQKRGRVYDNYKSDGSV